MSTVQTLRAFVSQRLTVAVEEIIGMFERTLTEYEEEIDRHRRLLAAEPLSGVTVTINAGTDTQPLTVSEKTDCEQQELSPSLHQEAPQPPCIKEEPDQVWSSWGGEQFQERPGGAGISQFHLPPISMKSEDEGETGQSSQCHPNHTEAHSPASSAAPQIQSRAAGEGCGGSEAAFDLDIAGFLKATSNGQLFSSQCFETEAEVLDVGWNQMMESRPFSNTPKANEANRTYSNQKKSFKCPACNKTFRHNAELQRHISCHTGERPFPCTECGQTFRQKGGLHIHMRKHTGEKPFSCLVCAKKFSQSGTLSAHMRIHTGEKPFSCSLCKKRYNERGTLVRHMRVHTGEKPFPCSLCGKRFSEKGNLNKHKRIHTGEKPFSCSDCEKKFNLLSHFKNHKCPVHNRSEAAEQARHLPCPKVTVQLSRHTL